VFRAHQGPLANASIGLVASNIFARNPPFVLNPYGVGINFDGANANAVGRMLSLRLAKSW
jgi:hypothetical protein